jgi:hypothetical protein
MTLDDFEWISDQLRGELQQDPLGRGNPLSVEAQVAVGLYHLAHGVCYVTIGHIFNIGKETADKASGRFVNAVLKILRLPSVGQVAGLLLDFCDDGLTFFFIFCSFPPPWIKWTCGKISSNCLKAVMGFPTLLGP